jgi:hypothetical protein
MADSKSSNIAEMISMNQFEYDDIGDISIVDKRMFNKFTSTGSSSYAPGQKINFKFPNDSEWIFGPTSYLTFEMKVTTTDANFGAGSAMNLVNEVQLKNGKLIEKVENKNVISGIIDRYTLSKNTLETSASIEGFEYGSAGADITAGDTHQFVIPLSKLCGFFSNTSSVIPSWAIAGADFSIVLEAANVALTSADGLATYTVNNPAIMIDTFSLVGAAQSWLTDKGSSSGGLVYTYPTWTHQQLDAPGTNLSKNVGESKSQVLYAVAISRIPATNAANEGKAESLNAEGWKGGQEFRYKMGASSYYPVDYVDNSAEAMFMANHVFDKNRDNLIGNAITHDSFKLGDATMSATFERGHILKLSGMPLNTGGSRLMLSYKVGAADATRTIDCWVQCVQMVQVFSDGKLVVVD